MSAVLLRVLVVLIDIDIMNVSNKITINRVNSTASVINKGSITAKDGGLVALVAPNVSNSGQLIADGGRIAMTASSASNIIDNAINMSGIVQANSVGMVNGEIIFAGTSNTEANISSNINATDIATQLSFSFVRILADNDINILDNIDISSWLPGTTNNNL